MTPCQSSPLLRWLLVLPWLVLALHAWGEAEIQPEVFQHPLGRDTAAFTELASAMQRQLLVQGEFIQTRYLQMLERPLVTKGGFTLSPQVFEWRIEQPFALSYSFAGQRLTREVDGKRQTIEPASEPALFGFFSFFTSLFSLSQESLEKLFSVYFLPSPPNWEMGLTPKQAQLAASVRQLHISGSGELIERVRLTEVSGDATEIRFIYPTRAPEVQ